jgi:DNA-binding NarL/FixJ family response regulator
VRIVLADREPAVRRALRVVLLQDADVGVVAEIDSLAALRREVETNRPDLLVVAWNLVAAPAENPAAALAGLRRSCPGLRVVVLGLRPESRREALAAGADAYVSKVDAPDLVRRTLQTTLAGPSPAG